MTLIIETGAQIAGSNTYVSDTEYVAYAAARGKTIGSDAAAREIELIKSMDFIESHRDQFKGCKVAFDQSLQWPRNSVWIDGYPVDFDAIPDELKNAQMESAIAINSFELLNTGKTQNVKKERLGQLEVEYFDGGSWEDSRADTVDVYLNVLLKTSATGINARAFR